MGKKSKKRQEPKTEPEVQEVQDSEVQDSEVQGSEVQDSEEPQPDSEQPQSQPQSHPQPVTEPTKPTQPPGNDSLHQEIGKLRAQLDAVENERDDIQDQYEELLDKVGHIKTTLGQRLKNDAAELAKVREELESLKVENKHLESLKKAVEDGKKEVDSKYAKDHAQLGYIELQLSEEQEKTKNLEARVAQLTEDVDEQSNYAEHYRKSHQEASTSAQRLEQELTAKVDQAESRAAEQRVQAEASVKQNLDLAKQLETLKAELETHAQKASSVEELSETVREKNILIGKLRHEAVILNEHLTNALRIVKKDSEGQTVDKDLVSNLIVQFVTIPRGDTKKFEVLQLIASFLNWDEDRRVEAGLSRSGQQGPERSLGGFLGKFAEFMERESRKS